MPASDNAQLGGAFDPAKDINFTGALDFSALPTRGAATVVSTTATQTLSGKTLTTPVIGAATGTSLAVTGAITSSGTAGIGYATGAGGAVTQATSKATGVTLSKMSGVITTAADALAAGVEVTFIVTNTLVAATDVPVVALVSGATANSYLLTVSTVAAGSYSITISNATAGSLSETLVINAIIIKGVNA